MSATVLSSSWTAMLLVFCPGVAAATGVAVDTAVGGTVAVSDGASVSVIVAVAVRGVVDVDDPAGTLVAPGDNVCVAGVAGVAPAHATSRMAAMPIMVRRYILIDFCFTTLSPIFISMSRRNTSRR